MSSSAFPALYFKKSWQKGENKVKRILTYNRCVSFHAPFQFPKVLKSSQEVLKCHPRKQDVE